MLLLFSVPAYSVIKANAGCAMSGELALQGRKLFKCVKVGKKLHWKYIKGENSLGTTFPLSGRSWLEIAQQKEAIERVVAGQLAQEAAERKARIEAELAAAELKAKKEAEARAAKTEAERPKIQGLLIGNLLWSEDFKGPKGGSIDPKNWSARNCHRVPASLGGGACFDAEVVYYAPSAIALDGSEDGAAIISTRRVSGKLPTDSGECLSSYCTFVSGRFDTHGKVAFQYGFIEARIKMPQGSGNHPAFWMLGDNINQIGWPTSGELDITEIRGNEPTIATSATHYSTSYSPNACCGNHQYKVASLPVGEDVTKDFHTYAVAWLPNSISYYFDGRLISTSTPQSLGGHWSFNDKFFLILNNAVNASFSGSWNDLNSSSMTIDWVRSYQLNGEGQVFTK